MLPREKLRFKCVNNYEETCIHVFRKNVIHWVKPGKIFESLETPGKALEFFLLSPGKSHRTSLKKKIHEMVHFVDFITCTSDNQDCRFWYHFKTSFCVRNHCIVLKQYWSTLLLYIAYIINYN